MELIEKDRDFEIYRSEHYIVLKDGKEIILTPTENKLLRILAHNKGQIVPNNTFISEVWGYSEGNNILRVNMANLRHKIGHIQTIKGKGYMFM